MKLLIQILFFFLTWFTNINATLVCTKVALSSYHHTFSKTLIVKEENTVKIGEQKVRAWITTSQLEYTINTAIF